MEKLSVTYVAQVFTPRLPGPHGGLGNRGPTGDASSSSALVLGPCRSSSAIAISARQPSVRAWRQRLYGCGLEECSTMRRVVAFLHQNPVKSSGIRLVNMDRNSPKVAHVRPFERSRTSPAEIPSAFTATRNGVSLQLTTPGPWPHLAGFSQGNQFSVEPGLLRIVKHRSLLASRTPRLSSIGIECDVGKFGFDRQARP